MERAPRDLLASPLLTDLIDVWGVGTRLVTAWDQPALGGVYKLAAIEREDGWRRERGLHERKTRMILDVRNSLP